MLYQKSKVYYDGSHYIAIPQENFKRKQFNRKRSKTTTTTIVDQTKQKFETAYAESQSLPKRERKKYIAEKMRSEFSTTEQAIDYIEQNIERKKNNLAKRRVRLWRKIYLQEWNYFVTFTYVKVVYGHIKKGNI